VKLRFFRKPADFRKWLEKHHASDRELWVGYYKTGSGKASVTWPESVDEALCFGWIDGLRKGVDASRYCIRFSPRKPTSIWSAVNIKKVRELAARGRMRPAGLQAFAKRKEYRSGIYAYEQRSATLVEPYAARLKKNRAAWNFFRTQPPYYQKRMNWWVVSAKLEATRLKRLKRLEDDSARGRRVGELARPAVRPPRKRAQRSKSSPEK
jgi:uncharacterized protein YdeI (YjbR/CyaY-like superfamily)